MIGISTHTPLAGRDYALSGLYILRCLFLLTRPSRGVTGIMSRQTGKAKFLLTRPSRGVTGNI